MVKQIITVASFLLGGSGVVLVAHLQSDPMAFTSIPTPRHESTRLEVEAPSTIHDAPLAESSSEAVTEFALETVRAGRPTGAALAERELSPCSAWYEIGAATIQEGGAVGTHAVRRLCRGKH